MIKQKAYSRYRRGDVWFVYRPTEQLTKDNTSHVQKKSRPFLIVSCEENNNCAPTINAIPITSREFDHLPMHVYYQYQNHAQMILCEQITTLDMSDLENPHSNYMYGLSESIMLQVDDALAAQLGIKARVADMKVLENIIDKLASDKEAEMKRKYEDALEARVETIANMLAKKFGIDLKPADMLSGLTYRPEQLRNVSTDKINKIEHVAKERTTPHFTVELELPPVSVKDSSKSNTIETPKQKTTKRAYHQWTSSSMKKFIDECQSMGYDKVAAKYNIAISYVPTLKNRFKRKLNLSH